MTDRHEPQEEYAGPATLLVDDRAIAVRADLRGRFEPIDGRFHWYGRVAGDSLDDVPPGSLVRLATSHGEATARLSDVDPWGRPRVSGVGRPPF